MMQKKDQAEKLRWWFQRTKFAVPAADHGSPSQGKNPQNMKQNDSALMGPIMGVAIVGLVVAAVILSALKAYHNSQELNRLKEQRVQSSMSMLSQAVQSLENSLQNTASQTGALSQEISYIRQENSRLQNQVDQTTNDREMLSEELRKAQEKIAALEQSRQAADDDVARQMVLLQRTVGNLNAQVEAQAQHEEELRVAPKAQVMQVNSQYGFVVINQGAQQGVQEGDELDVRRNNSLLGRIRVLQSRKNVSAAQIISGSGAIEKGDEVVLP